MDVPGLASNYPGVRHQNTPPTTRWRIQIESLGRRGRKRDSARDLPFHHPGSQFGRTVIPSATPGAIRDTCSACRGVMAR